MSVSAGTSNTVVITDTNRHGQCNDGWFEKIVVYCFLTLSAVSLFPMNGEADPQILRPSKSMKVRRSCIHRILLTLSFILLLLSFRQEPCSSSTDQACDYYVRFTSLSQTHSTTNTWLKKGVAAPAYASTPLWRHSDFAFSSYSSRDLYVSLNSFPILDCSFCLPK